MITLVALLCHLTTAVPVPLCEETVIPTTDKDGHSLLAAGKIDDPLEMPWNERVCKEQAQWLLAEYLQTNEAHHGWWPAKYGCVKDYVPLQNASYVRRHAEKKTWAWAYEKLNGKPPLWCAVVLGDIGDKEEGMVEGECMVRKL